MPSPRLSSFGRKFTGRPPVIEFYSDVLYLGMAISGCYLSLSKNKPISYLFGIHFLYSMHFETYRSMGLTPLVKFSFLSQCTTHLTNATQSNNEFQSVYELN